MTSRLAKTICMNGLVLAIICLLPRTTVSSENLEWVLPVWAIDRTDWSGIGLTKIGQFALQRSARQGISAHFHTGIDIRRPNPNYVNEPIFAVAEGEVISLRDDGPYAQVIVAHRLSEGRPVWTVYEHIAGIRVKVGQIITPQEPIARFMNRRELDTFGWQFDHVHFEVLKHPPRPLVPAGRTPDRLFGTYSLECYTMEDLRRYYYAPMEFLEKQ